MKSSQRLLNLAATVLAAMVKILSALVSASADAVTAVYLGLGLDGVRRR